MIAHYRTSEDFRNRSRWSLWRFNRQDITEARKIDRALMDVPPSGPIEYLTESQQKQLLAKAAEGDGAALEQFLSENGYKAVADIPQDQFARALEVCG